jgi:hypothetical protein
MRSISFPAARASWDIRSLPVGQFLFEQTGAVHVSGLASTNFCVGKASVIVAGQPTVLVL